MGESARTPRQMISRKSETQLSHGDKTHSQFSRREKPMTTPVKTAAVAPKSAAPAHAAKPKDDFDGERVMKILRLGKDAELREKDGANYAMFRAAETVFVNKADGSGKEKGTVWHTVFFKNGFTSKVAALKKGDQVVIDGWAFTKPRNDKPEEMDHTISGTFIMLALSLPDPDQGEDL
jgi:hypothetical protein